MAEDEVEDAQLEAALVARERTVDAALRAGTAAVALRAALADPPFASRSAALKDRNAAIVTRACVAVGAKDIELATFLEGLDADASDTLLKYIYRGLASPASSALFLKLHGALVDKAGLGASLVAHPGVLLQTARRRKDSSFTRMRPPPFPQAVSCAVLSTAKQHDDELL